MKTQFIIRSNYRRTTPDCYFAAIHSYTPMFFSKDKARRFSSREMATAYARTELFTEDLAFSIEEVPAQD